MTTHCNLNNFSGDIRVLEVTESIWKHHSTLQIGLNNSILKTPFTVYSPFYPVAVMPLGSTRHVSGQECMGAGEPSKFQPNRTWILPCRWSISAECCQFSSVGSVWMLGYRCFCVPGRLVLCRDTWHSCDKLGGNMLRSLHLLSYNSPLV